MVAIYLRLTIFCPTTVSQQRGIAEEGISSCGGGGVGGIRTNSLRFAPTTTAIVAGPTNGKPAIMMKLLRSEERQHAPCENPWIFVGLTAVLVT